MSAAEDRENLSPSGSEQNNRRQPKIFFDLSKKELYTPTKGYKQIIRRLKQHFTVDVNTQEITLSNLLDYDIAVFAAPQDTFSEFEFDIIRQYLDRGGSTFLLLGDGHGGRYSPLNRFLNGYGIALNEDCVVR